MKKVKHILLKALFFSVISIGTMALGLSITTYTLTLANRFFIAAMVDNAETPGHEAHGLLDR